MTMTRTTTSSSSSAATATATAHSRIHHILPHLCGGQPLATKNVNVGSALKEKFQKEGGR
jgi:hypothetical protein